MAKTVQSRKAKGRKLQQQVASALRTSLGVSENDIKSLPMGSQGQDVWLSQAVKDRLPLAIECKAQENLNVWAGLAQAKANAKSGEIPVLAFKRNRTETFVALELTHASWSL